MSLPEIASHHEWVAARKELLEREKAFTRARDELAAARRKLPMVLVEKDYRFEGPDGVVGLIDLFEGRHQLIVCHFMFDPEWEDGCSSCTAGADEMAPGTLAHLNTRDTTLAYVSRAPYPKIADYRRRRGWTFPWYSSFRSPWLASSSSLRASSPGDLASCEMVIASSTPTRSTRAGWRRSAAPTTCSRRPRSGARRTGRNRPAAPRHYAAPGLTSPPEQAPAPAC